MGVARSNRVSLIGAGLLTGFFYILERCPSGLRYTLGKGACPKDTGGSNPPLSAYKCNKDGLWKSAKVFWFLIKMTENLP